MASTTHQRIHIFLLHPTPLFFPVKSILTPMVAIKNPARCESHPNISEDRQGTEDTIISWEKRWHNVMGECGVRCVGDDEV